MRRKEEESGVRSHLLEEQEPERESSGQNIAVLPRTEDDGTDEEERDWMNRIEVEPSESSTVKPKKTRKQKRQERKEHRNRAMLEVDQEEFERLQATDITLQPLWERSATRTSRGTDYYTGSGYPQEDPSQWTDWCSQNSVGRR